MEVIYPMKPDAGKIWKQIPFDELLKALWGKAGRNAINIFRYSGSRLFTLINTEDDVAPFRVGKR
jgi:hypothetical protein